MQSGNSAATSSGPSGAASAVAPRKSMRGCWRKGECSSFRDMPYTVNACFEKFCKEVVDLDPEQTKTARTSRDFVLSNIARLSNEGELPNVLGDFCLNFGSFARNTKIRPLDDIDIMICYDGLDGVYDTIHIIVCVGLKTFYIYKVV